MRTVALILVLLAALAFLVGTYSAFTGAILVGKAPVTYWRGAVGFLLFAITLLMLERKA
ncbi:MAG: hypothetical protein ACOY3Y_13850 [Acidobacteriota bacterium]